MEKSDKQIVPILLGINSVLLAIIAFSLFQDPDSSSTPEITKWEYKVGSVKDLDWETTGNELGSQGWEIINARRARDSLDNYSYECIWKRPLITK